MNEGEYTDLFIQCCRNGHLAPAIFALEKYNSHLLIIKGIILASRIGNTEITDWLINHPKFDITLLCETYVESIYSPQIINYVIECFNKKQSLEIAYYKLISISRVATTPIHIVLERFYKPCKYKNIVEHVYYLAIQDDNIHAMQYLYYFGSNFIRNLTKRLICETLDLGNTTFVKWYFSMVVVPDEIFTYGLKKYKKDKCCLYNRVILYINCFNERQITGYRYHPVLSDAIVNRYQPVIFNENYPKWFMNNSAYQAAMLTMKNGLKNDISLYVNIADDVIGIILDYSFGTYNNSTI